MLENKKIVIVGGSSGIGFAVAQKAPTPGRAQHVTTLSPTLPLNRLGAASEIADAYLYLFGNSYSTGTVLVVDGGALC